MADQPNVVLLFTDQQRFDTIAAAGFDHMVTPNLDRLANEGALFTHAYTPNPVCIPARHNVITGLPAKYHGFFTNMAHPLRYDLPVLPRILSDAGYDTRAVGKMHFRPPRRHNGFDRMELMEEIPRFREDDEYATYLKEVGLGHIRNIHGVRNLLYMVPQQSLIPEEHHGSTWVGTRSADYIRANAGRRPFFLFSGWIAPHPPFDVPDTFADLYRDRDIPEPYVSETPMSQPARQGACHGDGGPRLVRRMRELYCSAISLVDKNVGRILKALEDIGELDNTLIIFTSDHGEMLGDHGSFQKMQPYDSSSRIPFLVRYPERFRAGEVHDEFVDLNDILPTALDVCGLDYPGPERLPGASVLRDVKDRACQYMEYGIGRSRWISLRDGRHKYNYFYGGGREELFDMREDPCEAVNLLSANGEDAAVREARERLRAGLVEYERRWGPPQYVAGAEFLRLEASPVVRCRNGQFHHFPDVLPEAEREAMNSTWEETILAVANEEAVHLHELDLEAWMGNGAPPEVIERIRRERL